MSISVADKSTESRTAQWGQLYSARQTYGPLVGLPDSSPLTPGFWHNLTNVFETNDTAFQLFNTFLSRGGAVTACDSDCKNTTICDMRAFRSENNCVSMQTSSLNWKSRTANDVSGYSLAGLPHSS